MESTGLGPNWLWRTRKNEGRLLLWPQVWVSGWVVGPFTTGMSGVKRQVDVLKMRGDWTQEKAWRTPERQRG